VHWFKPRATVVAGSGVSRYNTGCGWVWCVTSQYWLRLGLVCHVTILAASGVSRYNTGCVWCVALQYWLGLVCRVTILAAGLRLVCRVTILAAAGSGVSRYNTGCSIVNCSFVNSPLQGWIRPWSQLPENWENSRYATNSQLLLLSVAAWSPTGHPNLPLVQCSPPTNPILL